MASANALITLLSIALVVFAQSGCAQSSQVRLRQSMSTRQQRKKCNREIQFCTRQNSDIFGLFVQTVLSIDQQNVNSEEAHKITENLCITFRPIFECVDRRNASWCSVPIHGKNSKEKLFHINYFVLVCELAQIWRQCSVVGDSGDNTKVGPVCSDHFPALHREAEQLRLLNNPNQKSSYKNAPVAPPSNFANMEFILLNMTESHCEDIMMFTGCQLHWTRSICDNKAYDIVKRLFAAYNDMSGQRCSGRHELEDVDFDVLERKYAERYLFLTGKQYALNESQVIEGAVAKTASNEVYEVAERGKPQVQQVTRDTGNQMPAESRSMFNQGGQLKGIRIEESDMEIEESPLSGSLNSLTVSNHGFKLSLLFFILILQVLC